MKSSDLTPTFWLQLIVISFVGLFLLWASYKIIAKITPIENRKDGRPVKRINLTCVWGLTVGIMLVIYAILLLLGVRGI